MRNCIGHDHETGHIACAESCELKNPHQLRCTSCARKQTLFGRRRRHRVEAPEKCSIHQRNHWHYRRSEYEPMKRKDLKCNLCGSMPWACEPGRFAEAPRGGGNPVEIAPEWKCIGCGLEYAPMPPIARASALRSSMGGEFWRKHG